MCVCVSAKINRIFIIPNLGIIMCGCAIIVVILALSSYNYTQKGRSFMLVWIEPDIHLITSFLSGIYDKWSLGMDRWCHNAKSG